MKHYFPFFIFIFFAAQANISFGQLNIWRQQNPPGEGVTYRAVQMLSFDTIYACGDNATFGRSTDGGVSWNIQSPTAGLKLSEPYSLNFYGLSFLNSKYGMVCGDSGRILKTIDGGTTWIVSVAIRNNATFMGIAVVDTNVAIAIGKGGLLARSDDGGKSWKSVPRELTSELTTIRKLRPDFLSISGYSGTLMTSVDSGKTWKTVPIVINGQLSEENIYGHVFVSERSATIVGNNGFIAHTLDSGKFWSKQVVSDSIILTNPLNYIDGKNPSVMAIVGDYGAILYTTDGGLHWNRYPLILQDSLVGLSFFDTYNAIAIGQDGIVMKTSNGGVSWQFIPERPFTNAFYGVAFPKGDTSLGVAVGFGGILRTTNGGAKWAHAKLDTTVTLRTVTFLDANTIIAAGHYGVIVKSTDAGMTWNIIPNQIGRNLFSMTFPTPNFGWVCGDSGSLFETNDAGASWTKHPFAKKRTLTGISFADSLHGYLCSDKGVYSTTDGGVTWEDPDDNTYFVPCVGIHSPSANFVCAIGTGCGGSPGCTILISRDVGKTWNNNSFGFGSNGLGVPTGVQFADELHGTIVGAGNSNREGFIFHTTDGGITWKEQGSSAFWALEAVFFGTNKAGTAVGYRGTIIRRTTDE